MLFPSFPVQNVTRADRKSEAVHHCSPGAAGTPPAPCDLSTCWRKRGLERGRTGEVPAALPTQSSPSRAGHHGLHSSVAHEAQSAAAGHPASAVGTANSPSAGAHLEGVLPTPVPSRQLWHSHCPRAVQPASLSHARPVSLIPLIGWDERHAAGRTHVSHNLNHLRAL